MKYIQAASRKLRIIAGKSFTYLLPILIISMLVACASPAATPTLTAVPPTPTRMPTPTPVPSLANMAGGVCQGQGLPEAASFSTGSNAVPAIFIVNMDGSPNAWNDSLPTLLLAKSVDTLEAVLCIGTQESESETVGDCGTFTSDSGGDSIDLKLGIYHLDTRLVAASTGKTIAEEQLKSKQADCPTAFSSKDPHIVDSVLYEDIGFQDVLAQLLPVLIPRSVPHQIGNPNMGANERVAISPDASLLASVETYDATSIKVWDVNTNSQLSDLSGFESDQQALAFSPDGSRLASLGITGELILWDVQSGQILHKLAKPDKDLLHQYSGQVAFSPNGKTLANTALQVIKSGVSAGMSVRYLTLWDVESGKLLQESYGVDEFSLSPNWTTLVSFYNYGDKQKFTFWDMNPVAERAHYEWQSEAQYGTGVASFSPDGVQLLALGLLYQEGILSGYQLLKLDIQTGQLISEAKPRDFPPETTPESPLVYLADQNKLIACEGDSNCASLLVFDLEQDSLLYKLKVQGSDAGVYSLAITPDGKYLVTDKLFLWDISWLQESK